MDFQVDDLVGGRPFVLSTRPARQNRHHDHDRGSQQIVYVDGNGLLVPSGPVRQGLQRSHSVTANTGRRSPTQIFITNTQREEHSPVRSSRRRSINYDKRYSDDGSSDEEYGRQRRDRRQRSSTRYRHESRHNKRESPIPPPHHNEHEEPKHHIDPVLLKKVEEYEREKEEAARRKKYDQEQIVKAAEEKAKKEKEEAMKKAAVAEYNAKQIAEEAKEKKAKEEADKAFQERVKTTFRNAGYSDQSIERILEKEGKGQHAGEKKIMDLTRPTYIKVHRKYLSPDTLDVYELPWEWDDVSLPPKTASLPDFKFTITPQRSLDLANYS